MKSSAQQKSAKDMPDSQATEFYEQVMKVMNPAYKTVVLKTAASLKNKVVDASAVQKALRSNKVFGKLDDMNIEALVFVVMMELSKAAETDLKAIMEEVKKTNETKAKLRQLIKKQQELSSQVFKSKYKATADVTMEEMNEMQQLRMQMYLERRQHMYTTISNIMKKLSDTASTIIQNMK